MSRYEKLSNQFPQFEYHEYAYRRVHERVEGEFAYHILNNKGSISHRFTTFFSIVNTHDYFENDLDTFIFNLGIVESISYWKLTCSPKFHISCGIISEEQICWWKKLFKNGLSEFFYINGIFHWDESQFSISSSGKIHNKQDNLIKKTNKVILPIGGGKDSITSYYILKDHVEIVPLMLNPIQASINFLNSTSAHTNSIEIVRKLDPKILKLNQKGYLNGHVPFSAILSFYCVLAAILNNITYIALSNESSANESTILGTNINHQYSKSWEYEKDFSSYCRKHLDNNIHYFSLLRPLNEYQITKIFSQIDYSLLKLFRSCNVGSKKGVWCCNCSKCLFTYIMIHAHMDLKYMLEIFGEDLLSKLELKNIFLELTGQSSEKPFECVGTIDEVNFAVAQIMKKRINQLPVLLNYWNKNLNILSSKEILDYYDNHLLDDFFNLLVKEKLYASVQG